jgi:uncharacterized membrane protein
MALLLVLLISFLLISLIQRFSGKQNHHFAGRIALSIMLIFTAIGHFLYTEGMAMMLPDFFPFKEEVVILTGLIEIAAAAGLLLHKTYRITSWLLIILFIAVLPANIYAAVQQVSYQKANYQGPGAGYLWFRIPLQLLFIGWVYYFGIHSKKNAKVIG